MQDEENSSQVWGSVRALRLCLSLSLVSMDLLRHEVPEVESEFSDLCFDDVVEGVVLEASKVLRISCINII